MAKDNPKNASDPKTKEKTGAEANKKPTRSWKKSDWIARAKEAGISNAEKMTVKGIRAQLKKLKNEGKIPDKRQNNGGHENVGRKPQDETLRAQTATELFEVHMNEMVDVLIKDNSTQRYTTKKVATLRAMLDTLRQKALKESDVRAIIAYMDRVIGKPRQTIEHSGEIKQEEQRPPTKAELEATDAYIKVLEKHGEI